MSADEFAGTPPNLLAEYYLAWIERERRLDRRAAIPACWTVNALRGPKREADMVRPYHMFASIPRPAAPTSEALAAKLVGLTQGVFGGGP